MTEEQKQMLRDAGLIDDCKKNVEILREYYKSKDKHDKRRVDKKDRNT